MSNLQWKDHEGYLSAECEGCTYKIHNRGWYHIERHTHSKDGPIIEKLGTKHNLEDAKQLAEDDRN